ncbi:MAG: hypothetical protein JWQ38_891 [Flavipsychrobacter sp.]|nr:hypothetical protein [Flavipsychrobacter sp.]
MQTKSNNLATCYYMHTDKINYLNIGLMVLSCIIAFIIPFELFVFSYALLGPLHYLTEISWLHKRQYFSPGKKDFIILGLLVLLISLADLLPYFYNFSGPKDTTGRVIISQRANDVMMFMFNSISALIFAAFACAALMVFTHNRTKRIIGFAFIALVGYLLHQQKFLFIIFSILLPTLVHVFVFTGAFLLLGALRSRRFSGILSVLVFLGCAISPLILFRDTITAPMAYTLPKYEATIYLLDQQLFEFFTGKSGSPEAIYHSSFGTRLARFIGFAYTYHYLNWFSKTSVIKWHKMPRKSLLITLTIWVLSVLLYFMDNIPGLILLGILSDVHVIFELPLNIRSFREIGTELMLRMPGK